jgi:superoxide reductase
MLKRHSVYKCAICGNIVEVLQAGGGTLTCCGQEMDFQEGATADTSLEKHVPYIEKIAGGYLVKIGEKQDHPMMDAHYIVWIELTTDLGNYRRFLKPGEKPEAIFLTSEEETAIHAREYCNLHGLWKS